MACSPSPARGRLLDSVAVDGLFSQAAREEIRPGRDGSGRLRRDSAYGAVMGARSHPDPTAAWTRKRLAAAFGDAVPGAPWDLRRAAVAAERVSRTAAIGASEALSLGGLFLAADGEGWVLARDEAELGGLMNMPGARGAVARLRRLQGIRGSGVAELQRAADPDGGKPWLAVRVEMPAPQEGDAVLRPPGPEGRANGVENWRAPGDWGHAPLALEVASR